MKVVPTERFRERLTRRCRLRLPLAALLLAALAHVAAAQPSATTRRAAAARNSPEQARAAQGAATRADYRGRVGGAVAPLEELAKEYARVRESEKEEVWSKEGFNSDFVIELPQRRDKTFARVRELLPPRERVARDGGGFVEVDNTWVREALGGLESEKNYEKVAAGLRALAGRLRALEARLGEPDAVAQAESDRDAERGRLNSILRRPEFDRQAPKQPSALERLIEAILEWLSSLFPRGSRLSPGASPRISNLTLVLVGALCLAVLAYVARRVWLGRRGGGRKSPVREARVVLGERLEADQTASDLLDEAERLARAGELRSAIRKAYVALLCELGDRGVVRLAQHKTNRDYLDAVRRAARPRLYTELLPLTSDFELHWYGLRAASNADWESFKTRCRAIVKESRQ